MKNEKGNFLRTGQKKTVIWGFVFSVQSIMAIVTELLRPTAKPYKYFMTYKLSQVHLELLFNKIHGHCGWNNNPDLLQFNYALRRLLIRNSIEPSKPGNCTSFDDFLCGSNGILEIFHKRKEGSPAQKNIQPDDESIEIERTLIMIDDLVPNDLLDNILYYISGFIVKSLLPKLQCSKSKEALLLDPTDPTAFNMAGFPVYAKFIQSLQRRGLTFPSSPVM